MMSLLRSNAAVGMTVNEVVDQLRTDPNAGLTSEEALRRRKIHGSNNFEISVEDPLWKKYLDQVIFVLGTCFDNLMRRDLYKL